MNNPWGSEPAAGTWFLWYSEQTNFKYAFNSDQTIGLGEIFKKDRHHQGWIEECVFESPIPGRSAPAMGGQQRELAAPKVVTAAGWEGCWALVTWHRAAQGLDSYHSVGPAETLQAAGLHLPSSPHLK